ncbi:MAG: hydrogenase maturation protease [Anaerolineales bacterium]
MTCQTLDMRTLVLGLGNPILRDDGVGLRVAQALRLVLANVPGIEVDENTWGGLRLMERLVGYDRVIVVDAMCTGAPAGTVRLLSPDDMPTRRSASPHDTSLPVALELGRRVGLSVPESADITLVGIEALDVDNFGEDLTPEVEAAIPVAVRAIQKVLTDA